MAGRVDGFLRRVRFHRGLARGGGRGLLVIADRSARARVAGGCGPFDRVVCACRS